MLSLRLQKKTGKRIIIKKGKVREVLKPCLRTKKAVERVDDGDTKNNWLGKLTKSVGNRTTNRDNLNYRFVKIGQNTEKSS